MSSISPAFERLQRGRAGWTRRWRSGAGPPLAEFAYQRFAQAEIARLEELRLACLEERIDAISRAAAMASWSVSSKASVNEHPLREQLRVPADARALPAPAGRPRRSSAYQHARATLVDELGIEPGRTLRELQQAILRQDPSLDVARATGARQRRRRTAAPPRPRRSPSRATCARPSPVLVRGWLTSAPGGAARPESAAARDQPRLRRGPGGRRAARRHVEPVTAGARHRGLRHCRRVHEDDALRAVRAAAERARALWPARRRARGTERHRLALRVGISTGEVGRRRSAGRGSRRGRLARRQVAAGGAPGRDPHRTRDVPPRPRCGARRAGRRRKGDLTGPPARGLRRRPRPRRRFDSPMVGREREQRRLRRRLRAGCGRPLVPALHDSRRRRRRQVAARAGVPRRHRRTRRSSPAAAACPTARGSPTGRCSRPSRRRPGSTTTTRAERSRATARRRCSPTSPTPSSIAAARRRADRARRGRRRGRGGILGGPDAVRGARATRGRSCSSSTTSTGASRRSSTSSSTSRTGRATSRSCSSASPGPSCSTRGPVGAAAS